MTCFIITANVLDDEDGLFFKVNWIQLNLFKIVILTYSAIFSVLNEANSLKKGYVHQFKII